MNLRTIRLVGFDLDGTLTETQYALLFGLGLTAHALGYPHDPRKLQLLKGLSGREWSATAADIFRAPPEMIAQLAAWRDEYFLRYAKAEGVPLRSGASELLAYLRGKNKPLVLQSGSPAERVSFVLKTSGLEGCFDRIITRDDAYPSKPSPAGLLAVAAEYGVEPEECCYIGDGRADVLMAKQAGALPIYVPSGPELAEQESLILAELTCCTLAELLQCMRRAFG